MPSQKIVSQFSRNEFFSVLPTGFYIFVVIFSCVTVAYLPSDTVESLWSVLSLLTLHLQNQPILLIFLLFACYLLGSIFRALPVRWAEKTIPPFKALFPYPTVIREVLETLNSHATLTLHNLDNIPNVSENVPMDVFNYWKDTLCVNTVDGFEYYQSFETRSRFFAGIIWAAWIGMLSSVFIFIVRSGNLADGVGMPIFIISFILMMAFGSNFRRVRRQEVKALLLIYIAFLQKNKLEPQQLAAGDGK